MKISYIVTHERDPETRKDIIDKTYCGFYTDGIIRLGRDDDVTCKECLKIREARTNESRPLPTRKYKRTND